MYIWKRIAVGRMLRSGGISSGEGVWEVHNLWSACDAHINKKHLKQVYGPCHEQNCPYTNYNRDTFIAHVKKCENVDKQKHKVK